MQHDLYILLKQKIPVLLSIYAYYADIFPAGQPDSSRDYITTHIDK